MVVHARPLKKMKRRVTADFHDFFTFPSIAIESAGGSISDNGPFRTNVRVFLNKHALLPPPSSLFPHLLTWQILFRVGDAPTEASDSSLAGVCLDIIEEDVARSRSVYCDQCRVVGWSAHPVCTKRYHFIIKADGNSIGGYHKPCMCCGDILHLSESKCKSCNLQASTDDAEDWLYNQLENTSHVLHGVVHSNGYGHLLRVNGREGGSRVLSGCHIMDFWDRLCKVLGVRKVSVMDVSKKYGLEYRLLHSVTKGHPWYGDWGYEFGAGSFALTLDAYKRAVESLSSVPLSVFLCLRQNHSSHLAGVISYYQSLSESELVNIRDLFCFLLKLIRNAHNSPSKVCDATCNKRHVCNSGDLCPWAKSDIDRVEEAMLRVLRAVSGDTWVSIRALRGAVCKVGPPELLDYCLKELGGKIAADGMFVNATCNRDTGAIEYRLEPRSTESSIGTTPSGVLIVQDLRYLFESMLHPHTVVSYVPKETRDIAITSAEKLLDCKQFVKDYKLVKMSVNNNPLMCLPCRVELLDESDEHAMNPPPELLTLNSNATLSDLELEASRAFQDVYLMFKRFQVEDVVGFSGVDKSTQVKQLIGSAEYIRVRGRTNAKNGLSRFRMERGVERWTVDCKCGAKDDDGERMLACDVCSVWQHTRCSGIHDSETAPARFVCHRCRNPLTRAKSSVLCKESEVVTDVGSDSSFGGKSLAAYSNVR